jgi:hypothetical protein
LEVIFGIAAILLVQSDPAGTSSSHIPVCFSTK